MKPLVYGVLAYPEGEASPLSQRGVILRPVADAVLLFHGFWFRFRDSHLTWD
jgi:hypothetical protein